jgi:hypothetical protein
MCRLLLHAHPPILCGQTYWILKRERKDKKKKKKTRVECASGRETRPPDAFKTPKAYRWFSRPNRVWASSVILMPDSEGHGMANDARGMKLRFGVPNFGFQNYAFFKNAISQFASGGLVQGVIRLATSLPPVRRFSPPCFFLLHKHRPMLQGRPKLVATPRVEQNHNSKLNCSMWAELLSQFCNYFLRSSATKVPWLVRAASFPRLRRPHLTRCRLSSTV